MRAGMVDATGTRRRLEALAAIGWPARELQARLRVQKLPAQGRAVTEGTEWAVRRLFDELALVDGPSVKARTWARSRGLAPPDAWAPGTIDDPGARPRGQSRMARARRLHRRGWSVQRIAAELDIAPRTVYRDLDESADRVRRRGSGHGRKLLPHGTEAAHRRHVRHGEQPCARCAAAYAERHPGRALSPCGTTGAYRRHRQRGEPPCEPCHAAQLVYDAAIRRRQVRPPRPVVERKPKPPRARRSPAPCGTVAAYRRHLREGTDPCGPCREANAAKSRRQWHSRAA